MGTNFSELSTILLFLQFVNYFKMLYKDKKKSEILDIYNELNVLILKYINIKTFSYIPLATSIYKLNA